MMEWTENLPFSRSYLIIVVAVAVVVGGLAVFGQSSTLALAAAILGLYVLHLFSNWQLASNQRQQWQTLREVERMLGALDRKHQDPLEVRGDPDIQPDSSAQIAAVGTDPEDSDGSEKGPESTAASDVSAETPEPAVGDTSPADPASSPDERETPPPEPSPDQPEDADESVLVPRQYKLGTVAVVQRVLAPGEVARVLAVQDRQPDRRFGDIAVDLGLLTESELEELLETQKEGLYRPEAISRARRDLKKYRRKKAEELGTGS